MGAMSNSLFCYVPYLCAIGVALAAYLLSGRGSWMRLLGTFALGSMTALALMALARSFSVSGPVVLGHCSPLTLGAGILGAIGSISAFYEVRRHLIGGDRFVMADQKFSERSFPPS